MIVNLEDVGKKKVNPALDPKNKDKMTLERRIKAQHDMLYFESGRPKFDFEQRKITKRTDGMWGVGPGGINPIDTMGNMGADPAMARNEMIILADEKSKKKAATRQANMSKGMSGLIYSSPQPIASRDNFIARSVFQGSVGQAQGRRILTGA